MTLRVGSGIAAGLTTTTNSQRLGPSCYKTRAPKLTKSYEQTHLSTSVTTHIDGKPGEGFVLRRRSHSAAALAFFSFSTILRAHDEQRHCSKFLFRDNLFSLQVYFVGFMWSSLHNFERSSSRNPDHCKIPPCSSSQGRCPHSAEVAGHLQQFRPPCLCTQSVPTISSCNHLYVLIFKFLGLTSSAILPILCPVISLYSSTSSGYVSNSTVSCVLFAHNHTALPLARRCAPNPVTSFSFRTRLHILLNPLLCM